MVTINRFLLVQKAQSKKGDKKVHWVVFFSNFTEFSLNFGAFLFFFCILYFLCFFVFYFIIQILLTFLDQSRKIQKIFENTLYIDIPQNYTKSEKI